MDQPTWPIGDQAVAALSLHLDVNAACGLQGELVWPVGALVHLLPETCPLQGARQQAAAGERTGRCMWDITEGRDWTPATRRELRMTEGTCVSTNVCVSTWSAAAAAHARACWCLWCRRRAQSR